MARQRQAPTPTASVVHRPRPVRQAASPTRWSALGHEVLGIDEDAEARPDSWPDELTHVVQADSTDEEALRQLGVAEFNRAVVGIGTDIEASVLTVLALTELGVEEIWAKAISAKHGRILERVGAHHVVYPEAAWANGSPTSSPARCSTSSSSTTLPSRRSAAPGDDRLDPGRLGLRTKHGITVVGVKRAGKEAETALPRTPVHRTRRHPDRFRPDEEGRTDRRAARLPPLSVHRCHRNAGHCPSPGAQQVAGPTRRTQRGHRVLLAVLRCQISQRLRWTKGSFGPLAAQAPGVPGVGGGQHDQHDGVDQVVVGRPGWSTRSRYRSRCAGRSGTRPATSSS